MKLIIEKITLIVVIEIESEEEEVGRAEWGWKTIYQHQNKLSIPIILQHSNYQF